MRAHGPPHVRHPCTLSERLPSEPPCALGWSSTAFSQGSHAVPIRGEVGGRRRSIAAWSPVALLVLRFVCAGLGWWGWGWRPTTLTRLRRGPARHVWRWGCCAHAWAPTTRPASIPRLGWRASRTWVRPAWTAPTAAATVPTAASTSPWAWAGPGRPVQEAGVRPTAARAGECCCWNSYGRQCRTSTNERMSGGVANAREGVCSGWTWSLYATGVTNDTNHPAPRGRLPVGLSHS